MAQIEARGYERRDDEQYQQHSVAENMEHYFDEAHTFNYQAAASEDAASGTRTERTSEQRTHRASSRQLYQRREFKSIYPSSHGFKSNVEQLRLDSAEPIPCPPDAEEITVNGVTGIWMNKQETLDWMKQHGSSVLTEDIELCEEHESSSSRTTTRTDAAAAANDECDEEEAGNLRYERPALPAARPPVAQQQQTYEHTFMASIAECEQETKEATIGNIKEQMQ